MIELILTPILAFLGALAGNWLWHHRKWILTIDEENKEVRLDPVITGRSKVEYIEEPTQEQLDENAQPSWLRDLWNKIRRGE